MVRYPDNELYGELIGDKKDAVSFNSKKTKEYNDYFQ